MTEHRHVKMFVLNFLVGAGFFTTSLISTMIIGSMLGIQLKGTTEDLGTAVGTANFGLGLTVLLSFIVTGLLVWLWAHARVGIGRKILGIDNVGAEPKIETRKKIGLLLTIIVVGIVTSVIMVGFNGFIGKYSPNADLANPVTLWTALQLGNPFLLVSVILTMMVLGAIVTALGHWMHSIQTRIDRTPLA